MYNKTDSRFVRVNCEIFNQIFKISIVNFINVISLSSKGESKGIRQSHADGKKHKERLEDMKRLKITLSRKMPQKLPKNPIEL